MFRFIGVPRQGIPFGGAPENSIPEAMEAIIVVITGKSAASKLGLGNYDSTDVWNTPFAIYVETLRNTPCQTENKTKLPALESTLKVVRDEIFEAEKTLKKLSFEKSKTLEREIAARKRAERAVQRRLENIVRTILLREDEELLKLL